MYPAYIMTGSVIGNLTLYCRPFLTFAFIHMYVIHVDINFVTSTLYKATLCPSPEEGFSRE